MIWYILIKCLIGINNIIFFQIEGKKHGMFANLNGTIGEKYLKKFMLLIFILNSYVTAQDFDVKVHQTGLILERDDQTILSQHILEFPLQLSINFPTINITYDEDKCPLTKSILSSEQHYFKHQALDNLRNITNSEIVQQMQIYMKNEISTNQMKTFIAKHMQVLYSKRERRAFEYLSDNFYTLSGWTEHKFDKVTSWAQDNFDKSNERISDLGISVTKVTDSLSTVSKILCEQQTEFEEEFVQTELKSSFLQTLSYFASQVEEIKEGQLPTAVDDNFLASFCKKHFQQYKNSSFCSTVQVRNLFRVRLLQFAIDTDAIKIKMHVTVPETDSKVHSVYRVRYVPVFENINTPMQTNSRQNEFTRWLLQANVRYVGISHDEYNSFEQIIAFSGCDNYIDHNICTERALPRQERCIKSIMNGTKSEMEYNCDFTQKNTGSSCVARKTDFGAIISSLTNVHIHSSRFGVNTNAVFSQKGVAKAGVFFIPKSRTYVKLFTCNRVMLKIPITEKPRMIVVSVQPYGDVQFNYRLASINKRLETSISDAKKALAKSFNITTNASTNLDMIQEKLQNLTWFQYVTIFAGGLGILIVLTIITYFIRVIVHNCQKCKATKNLE